MHENAGQIVEYGDMLLKTLPLFHFDDRLFCKRLQASKLSLESVA